MRGRRRAAAAVVLAIASAALLVRSPALAEGVTTTPSQPIMGFDTAKLPGQDAMDAWKASGAYSAVGLYLPIGIPNSDDRHSTYRYTASTLAPWVSAQLDNGWSILPLYLGLQAPNECQPKARQHVFWAMSPDPAQAYAQGVAAADDAITSLGDVGLPSGAPVYYDMESYNSGCTAVQAFLGAWSAELNAKGYLAGVYGSRGSTMADLVARLDQPACSLPSAVWPAQYDGKTTMTGISPIPDDAWSDSQRVKQMAANKTETHGGVQMTVDVNVVDGPVVGPASSPAPSVTPVAGPCIPAPPGGVLAARRNRSATVSWTAPPSDPASPVTGYLVTDLTSGATHTIDHPTATSLRLGGLANGTTYSYAVSALNAVGASVHSATVTVTPAGAPKRVAKPTVTTGRGSITVRWRPAAANGSRITGYRVSVGSHRLSVGAGKRSATVKGLRPGTFRVTVTAVNAVGAGPASPAVRVRLRSRP